MEGSLCVRKKEKMTVFVCEWVNEGMKELQRMIERKWKEKKKLKENRSFKSVVYPCLAK